MFKSEGPCPPWGSEPGAPRALLARLQGGRPRAAGGGAGRASAPSPTGHPALCLATPRGPGRSGGRLWARFPAPPHPRAFTHLPSWTQLTSPRGRAHSLCGGDAAPRAPAVGGEGRVGLLSLPARGLPTKGPGRAPPASEGPEPPSPSDVPTAPHWPQPQVWPVEGLLGPWVSPGGAHPLSFLPHLPGPCTMLAAP